MQHLQKMNRLFSGKRRCIKTSIHLLAPLYQILSLTSSEGDLIIIFPIFLSNKQLSFTLRRWDIICILSFYVVCLVWVEKALTYIYLISVDIWSNTYLIRVHRCNQCPLPSELQRILLKELNMPNGDQSLGLKKYIYLLIYAHLKHPSGKKCKKGVDIFSEGK